MGKFRVVSSVNQLKKIDTKKTLPNQTDLIRFASFFLNNLVNRLEKDVDHCLKRPYAPFPTIIYCLATIDLLGALYKGEAAGKLKGKQKHKPQGRPTPPFTTSNSRKYMKRFMGYRHKQINLIWLIFRHKLIHLTEPKPAVVDNNKIIGWRYYHKNMYTHLKLTKLKTPTKLLLNTPYDIHCNYRFEISVTKLKDDIIDSIMRKPNGYKEILLKSKILQLNFRRAINEIYNPTKI
jgi:hypothetical protein